MFHLLKIRAGRHTVHSNLTGSGNVRTYHPDWRVERELFSNWVKLSPCHEDIWGS
jgi:hypothetical protein